MEYGFIENDMGLQEGYDPTLMYSGAFDSEFIHVSLLAVFFNIFTVLHIAQFLTAIYCRVYLSFEYIDL